MIEHAIRGRRVLTSEGLRPAAVLIEGDSIAAVAGHDEVPAGVPVREAGELAVLPALVDTHVHVNEPGRADWEGFHTATMAAAAGGISAIVDMPLNCSPVTTSDIALRRKLQAAEDKLRVDAAFWGGLIPGNVAQLEPMAREGVVGFKCFLTHSGLDEFPNVDRATLEEGMKAIAALGLPLIAHAELDPANPPDGDPKSYATYLNTRPGDMELRAVRLLIELCRKTRCRTHVVHLSCAEALEDIARAKEEGLPFTAETCPHYLTFAAEEVEPGRTEFKCAPPIRSKENREKLWNGLGRGVIDFVVSDHSPCRPELKKFHEGDFLSAWGGIAGLQFTLPATWTEAKRRGYELQDVAKWCSERTAAFAGMRRKGRLQRGFDADVVILDDAELFDLQPEQVKHRYAVTPYIGRRLLGAVDATYLRGSPAYDRRFPAPLRRGRALLRGQGTWTSPS